MERSNDSSEAEYPIDLSIPCSMYLPEVMVTSSGYKILKKKLNWEQEIIKHRPVYRWTALYSHTDYRFIGTKHTVNKVWPGYLKKIIRLVNELLSEIMDDHVEFNTVFAVYYPDGDSQIAYHSDDESQSIPGSHIASLTLGQGRDFLIKPYNRKDSTKKVHLADGDIFVMKRGFQQLYEHSIPKRKNVTRGRICLTFRSHVYKNKTPNKEKCEEEV